MLTRRSFAAGLGFAARWTESALAQRALISGDLPADTVWLNANENPEGPPKASIEAMSAALATTGRYHYQEYRDFYSAVAQSEGLTPDQIQIGAGSTEVLNIAVQVFTSATRPLIVPEPTFEVPAEMARALGRPVVRVPLAEGYSADVKRLSEEAGKAGGGLIYLCNPNNPTGSITPKAGLAWLAANLPANTVLLVDEAYVHFADSPELEPALAFVRQGREVIVTRTFSKIWGMAGLRAGFACARPELIARMADFRNNVISYVTTRAVRAGLEQAAAILPERRQRLIRTRRELCRWLTEREIPYIESQANFVMIDVGRDARELIHAMPRRGVAVGRPFPPLTNMLRVSLGTERDMARFCEVFWSLYRA